MRLFSNGYGFRWCVLSAVMLGALTGTSTNAAVTVIGTQYKQDDVMPEYVCYWHKDCRNDYAGANVHVFLKNTGGSSETVTDATLAGYSLSTVLKLNSGDHEAHSIYYYWDVPPQAIIDAGEPIWWRADPKVIPAGGVGQVVVRIKWVPVTKPISIGIVTSAGPVATTVPVSATAPYLASVTFSWDRKKVFLNWRRSGGAAPTTIKMDDVDVTAYATTVNDPNCNFAVSTLSFDTAIPNMSYHVYQGIYSDGATATASLRTWVNPFVHGCWGARDFENGTTQDAMNVIINSVNRGVNAMIYNGSGAVTGLTGSASGRQFCEDQGFGFVIDYINKWSISTPMMWFLDDEPDAEEAAVANSRCGPGLKLPCGINPMGILAKRFIDYGETLRASSPTSPTMINIDGAFRPTNYITWGQTVDVLCADPYYQRRLTDAYWRDQEDIYLFRKATYIYVVSKAMARAAEPNPSMIALYSCEWKCNLDNGICDEQYIGSVWPFASPECKRIEAYYSLAAGSKGLAYWWWKAGWPSNGLNAWTAAAQALWKGIGLYGTEIKTIAQQIVTSHPIDITLTPSTNVWARAAASGTDTIILYAVNDNYYNDPAGFHHTAVPNANVVVSLPSWMTSSPTAFEVRTSGLYDVATSQNGNNLTVQLGTLDLTRMIVITTNAGLRSQVQSRYVNDVWPGVCSFAPDHCTTQSSPPNIVQHPSSQSVPTGATANFTIVVSGATPLSYQWQKNNVNISNGGHYSGATTVTLTVSPADSNDVANYRCIVTNTYGTATSNAATLTTTVPTGPIITQQPTNQAVTPGGTAVFSVGATGIGTMTYIWQKNSADLANGGHYSGVSTATLTISNADTNDTANYRCVITDNYGSATSNQALLAVSACVSPILTNGNFEASTIANPPAGWTTYVQSGASGNWTIQTATPPQGTLWQQTQVFNTGGYGGVRQNVTGLTSGVVYTISGSYKTNSLTASASVRYNLAGNTDRANSTVLASTVVTDWGTFSGTVTATGESLTLFLDNMNGTFSNKASAFDNITVTGCGVSSVPIIIQHPVAQSFCPGTDVSFAVAATGSGTLTYLWQKNSVNLSNGGHYSGVSTATLVISTADSNDAANYRYVVSNAGGSVTSNQATLTLKPTVAADLDGDCDVDQDDFDLFAGCASGPTVAAGVGCEDGDFDNDNDVDQSDFGIFQRCYSGEDMPINPDCVN